MERRTGGAAVLALVAASLLWGTTGTAASLLPAEVSPLATGAATMGVGGALLFLVTARGAVAVLREREPRRWALIGAVGVVAYPLTFYPGMHLAGVAIGNVVALGSGPLFAALLEWMLERRRPTARWAASTVLAIAGIALLGASRLAEAGHRQESGAGEQPLAGIGLALVAGLAYALYSYASTRALAVVDAGRPSRDVMGAMFGVGAIPLLVLLAAIGAPLLHEASSIGIAAYLAIGPMLVAYLLFGIALRRVSSSTATTITLLEPVVATVLAVTVVGERLSPLGWVGMACVLAGLVLLVTARRGSGAARHA